MEKLSYHLKTDSKPANPKLYSMKL